MTIDHLLQSTHATPAAIIDAMLSPECVTRYLSAVDAPAIAEAFAADSYQHENGFTKISLGTCAEGRFKLRAHYWPRNARATPSNVHNHRFDFTSRILKGELVHTVYEPSSSGPEYQHYAYAPGAKSDHYVLQHLGSAFLKEVSQDRMSAGTVYHFPSAALHTSDPISDDPVATIFVEDRIAWVESCDVYSLRYPRRNVRIDAPPMTAARWLASLKTFLALGTGN